MLLTETPAVFDGTIRDNLFHDGSDEELWSALDMVSLRKLVEGRSKGLDEPLQTIEKSLSLGELQRLNLARAILRSPKVLAIDEGLSGIDSSSLPDILRAIDDGERIVLIVSHRPEIMEFCDKVYVMEAGRVSKLGG
jgi:ABC-type multidrug transport system fused ATPase/permease subunit